MGKEITTEDFIIKVESKYPNKFTFEKTIYRKSKEDVIITCKKHGDFLRKPSDILSNDNIHCVDCKKDENILKTTIKAQTNIMRKFEGNITLISYNSKNNSDFNCIEHGKFSQNYHVVVSSKYGCKKCANENKNTTTKNKTKNEAYSFLKLFFDTNNYFPNISFLKKLSKSCHTYFHDNGVKKYDEMMYEITPDYQFYINAHYDSLNRRCGSVYELILNNILIQNNIEHIYQYSFDDTKRTADYYFPKFNLVVEIAGRDDIEYLKKLKSKRNYYIDCGYNYIEVNPTDKSRYNLTYFLDKCLLELLNYLKIKNNVKVEKLLIGSNVINTLKKLIYSFIEKHSINNFYCRYIIKHDISLYNLIKKTFTTIENCCYFFNIDFNQIEGNKPQNYWSNPQNYIDEINQYIKKYDKNPTFQDLSCFTNLSYNNFKFDDFRPGGKYSSLINFSKNDNYKKKPNNYWTLDRISEYLVKNSINNRIPTRGRFKNENLDNGCLGAIYHSFGGLNNFKPNGIYYQYILKYTE